MAITKRDALKLVQRYQGLLGLGEWSIKVTLTAEDKDAYADCLSEPEYMKATIAFNLDKIEDRSMLKDCVIHELVHVALSPYTSIATSMVGRNKKALELLEESLVTGIERWPLWRRVK